MRMQAWVTHARQCNGRAAGKAGESSRSVRSVGSQPGRQVAGQDG